MTKASIVVPIIAVTGVDGGAASGDDNGDDDSCLFIPPVVVISARLVKHALRICGFKHVLHLPHF
jgi:hypothetical protein